ncbi:MAG: hypothetical protein R3E97_00790 [Candidatus Eisenbacteria bacterium]
MSEGGLASSDGLAPSGGLDASDVALLEEAFRLQAELGSEVWPTWGPMETPVLYKTGSQEFLIGHPSPPDQFVMTGQTFRGQPVLAAASTDSTFYLAAFPYEGTMTVVVSRPSPDSDMARWVVLANHEMFHVWQKRVRPDRVVEPFVGAHAMEHELSFPFPYDDDAVLSLLRLDGEEVFLGCSADSLPPATARRTVGLLRHVDQLGPSVFSDSLAFVYKKWMEWHEGVARYTERSLALLASDDTPYSPGEAFSREFPEASFEGLRDTYASDLNPIRFVGEGVSGRMAFYYLGMGKAYLLDRLLPGWKAQYFEKDLDALIAEAESSPMCQVE